MRQLNDHDPTGIVTPSAQLENRDTPFVVFSLCTLNTIAVGYQICKIPGLTYTITTDTHIADSRVITTEQLKFNPNI